MDNQTPVAPSQQLPATPLPQKSYGHNWKKWLLIYLIIAAVLYSGIYYFFLNKQGTNPYSSVTTTVTTSPSPTPDPTANWKTYTNTYYGYTMKYPPSESLSSIGTDVKESETSLIKLENPDRGEDLEIDVINGPINTTLLQWVQNNFIRYYKNAKIVPMPIDSHEGYLIEYPIQAITKDSTTPHEILLKSVYLEKNKNTIIVVAQTNPDFPLNQILSTLKFLNPTDNWKTYINPIGTLSIQYPPGWTVTESHTLSNRVVDNPKEINTTTIWGKEGKIVIEWGSMGFGGGCNPKDHKMFSVKNKTMDICTDSKEYWSGISNGRKDDRITEIMANTSKPTENVSTQTIQTILATITFLDTSVTPTCTPRPACLDSEPRCMIPETSDMCPRTTPTATVGK